MANITKQLSKKAGPDGKCRLLLYIYITYSIRVRLKTNVFVNPKYFEKKTGEVVIPKRGRLNQNEVDEAFSTKVEVDAYVNRIEVILSADRPKKGDTPADWKDWLTAVLELQDNPSINLRRDILTAKNIANAFELEEELREKAEAERKAQIAAEEAKLRESQKLKVVDALYDYPRHHKLSTSRVKSLGVIARMISRFILFIRATKDKNYELYVDDATNDDIESFRQYIFDEHKLALTHKRIFKKIMDTFPLSENPKIKRSLAPRGENYAVDIMKRLNAVFNWLYATKRTKNQPFATVSIGTEVYGQPVYINKAERDQIANYDLSDQPESIQVQRDIFVFQCLTGCRVCDLITLMPVNVHDGILEYVPLKTKDNTTQVKPRIPLNNTALQLIAKYEGVDKDGRLFPFIAPQNYNECIKKIFEACKINRNVIVKNPTTGRNEIRPINEVASSHMARRTFVGATYKVVKDPNLIGAMSGHAPGSKAFARYRKIDDDDLREIINQL